MKYKKIMLMLITAIFLVSITSVCATDANDTTIASEDINQMDVSSNNEIIEDNLKTSEENTALTQANNAETNSQILCESESTYYDLKNEIGDGGDKNLTKSYYRYTGGDAIEIKNSGVINGNGAVIDMNGSSIRAFEVSGSDVTIRNLTIKNVNINSYGGAIYFNGNRVTVINCSFTDNKVTGDGGAICFSQIGYHDYFVVNCTFIGNSAKYGGAIYGYGVSLNCTFIGNSANYGGALCYSCAVNCTFTGNDAENGKATYSGSKLNCIGQNDFLYTSDLELNWLVNDNYINRLNIYIGLTSQSVTHIDFINYDAVIYKDGSVVNVYHGLSGNKLSLDLTDGIYTAELIVTYPGINRPEPKNITLIFTNESTFHDLNDVINDNDKSEIYLNENYAYDSSLDSNFINGIEINRDLIINGNNFTINANGKARIFNVGNHNVILKDINFVNAYSAENGGAIYWNRGSSVSVLNCTFINNTAEGYGGAVYLYRGSSVSVLNCTFINNTAVNNNGGAIFLVNGNNAKVANCNFTSNSAKSGAAITWAGANGIVDNCNFIDNNATTNNGGAIYWSKSANGKITNCNFTGNSAKSGGAITWTGSDGSLFNCNFINNKARNGNGGAIYWSDSANGNLSYCNFTDNVAKSGGAISWTGINAVVDNCNFINNAATSIGGGAIYFANGEDGQIANCKFIGNFAKQHGGAVTWTGADGKVLTSEFINNTADLYGGAISWYSGPNGLVSYCNFIDNNANVNGSAISWFTNVNGSVVNSSFKNKFNKSALNVKDEHQILTLTLEFSIDYNNTIHLKPQTLDNLTYWKDITVNSTNIDSSFDIAYVNQNVTILIYNSKNELIDTVISLTNGTSQIHYDYSSLPAGNYTYVAFTLGNDEFPYVETSGSFERQKIKTQLAASEITTIYNINKDLVISLKDSNGKALDGVKISVDLNGVKEYTTDSNGQVKVSTKELAPKTYTAKITFNGNTNYDKSVKEVKVTVKKATPKITAKKKTFKATTKTKKYTIVLKDNTGKAIKNAKVTLKVKGKTYKAKTNSKGKATFKITKLSKKGTYKATVTYKANKYYKKLTKKAKIKVIVTFKTVSKGSKDKSTVKEIQQALKDKGYYLSYKGHYLKVDGKFSSCTVRSIKEFQHDKGLKVTGEVDEKTAKKLGIIN